MKRYLLSLFILVLTSALNAQIGNPEQDSCLIAKYYFNSSTVNDDYIWAYHGTPGPAATITTDRFGNSGAAWSLNGTPTSYLNLGTWSALKQSTLSVSMWFKVTAPEFSGSGYNFNPLLLTRCQTGGSCHESYCFYYDFTSGKIATANTNMPCNQPSVWTTSTIPSGAWHHLVFTFNNNTIQLYLDAVLQGAISKGFTSTYLASDSVMIGNVMDGTNYRYFNGSVDDIRFYNCVISQTKVTSLYNEPNWSLPTDIKVNKKNEEINIYPNPFNDKITIQMYVPFDFPFQIYNSLGAQIYSSRMEKGKAEIDLSNQPSGIYFIKAGSFSKKIIKQ